MYTDSAISAYITFVLLTLSLLLLWLRNKQHPVLRNMWSIVLIIASLLAYLLGQLDAIALLAMALIAILGWGSNRLANHRLWQALVGLLFTFATLTLGLHLVPGFHPLNVFHQMQLTTDAIPYTLNLNFDKSIIGLFIFGLWYQRPHKTLNWPQTATTLLWILPIIIAAVVSISLLAGYIRLEPKLIDHLGIWIWANLFFTCTAEEAFFRGLIQHRLANSLKNRNWGNWAALLIAAMLFGLAHLGGGWTYAFLAMLAGFGYGLVYKLTGRIEASIIGHFGLNLVHIVFFTYPALA